MNYEVGIEISDTITGQSPFDLQNALITSERAL